MASRASIRRSSRFHLLGLGVGLVIIADQMQKAMDDEMGQMVVERLAFQARPRAPRSPRPARFAQHRRQRSPRRGGKAGKDSTLVGLSLPRQPALSARMCGIVGEDQAELGRAAGSAPISARRRVDGACRERASAASQASRPPRPGYRSSTSALSRGRSTACCVAAIVAAVQARRRSARARRRASRS